MPADFLFSSLQDVMSKLSPELLNRQLGEFSCSRDLDVQSFLRDKAIDYERAGYSRTYLYQTYDSGNDGSLTVAAYFTVAITSVSFTDISRNKRMKVLGGFPGRDSQDHFAGLLIAQLARSDVFDKTHIGGKQLVDDAERIIARGRKYLGGKLIYVDCKFPLIKLYEGLGFKPITGSEYSDGLYKLFKVLPKLS
jgi:hypothetical protein